MKRIARFFDKLEDRIRLALSRRPIIYTFIGGVGVVLFWRGVWLTADMLPLLTGPVSIFVSVAILLLTGLFVSFFIGDEIIIKGLREEKKINEQTEVEIKEEEATLRTLKKDLEEIKRMLAGPRPK